MATVWARVRDKATGHHFDVSLERMQLLLERGAVEEIASHQRHTGKPHPAKPRRPLGTPAPTPKRAAKPPAVAVAEPKESEST